MDLTLQVVARIGGVCGWRARAFEGGGWGRSSEGGVDGFWFNATDGPASLQKRLLTQAFRALRFLSPRPSPPTSSDMRMIP